MKRKLLATSQDQTCADCQAQMSEYVRRELTGESVAALFPATTFHIETCPVCQALYYHMFHTAGMQLSLEDLRSLGDRQGLAAQFDDVLAALPPAADWSAQSTHQGSADYGSAGYGSADYGSAFHGRAWYDRATKKLRLLEIRLENLFRRPPQAPAAVLAGLQGPSAVSDGSAWRGASLVEGDLEMSLHIQPDSSDDPEKCRIEISVSREDHFGDFSGVALTLIDTAGEHTVTTDELGKAAFDGIQRSDSETMVLTIRLPD